MFEIEREVNEALHNIIKAWELMYYSGYRSSEKKSIEDYSMIELHLLKAIAHHGGKMLRSQLNSQVDLPVSTVSSIINRLVSNGCISRTPSAEDKRQTLLSLTELGSKINTEHDMIDINVAHNFVSRITYDEAKEFVRIANLATQESLISPQFTTKYKTPRKKAAQREQTKHKNKP